MLGVEIGNEQADIKLLDCQWGQSDLRLSSRMRRFRRLSHYVECVVDTV